MTPIDALGATVESGRRVGHFRLVSLLGAGGMGEVWRAEDEVLHRSVAFKLMRPDRITDEDARRRMLREARAQAALSHANICVIYEAGEGPEGVWIAMELLDGPTLSTRASSTRPSADEVMRWGHQMARALAAAHAKGLVHRDLKPGNAMLASDGSLKLLDFGLVRRVAASGHDETQVTGAGVILGTPRYMSPEQAGGHEVGPATDVFSLGVTLYELAAGRAPFDATTPMAVITQILRDEPAPLGPEVPSVLADVIASCLHKDPASRPSAERVAQDLGAGSTTLPSRPVARRRRPWLLGAGLVGALAIAGIAAFVVASRDSRAPRSSSTPPADAASLVDARTEVAARTIYGPKSSIGADFARAVDGTGWYFVDDTRLMHVGVDGVAQPVPKIGPVEALVEGVEGPIYSSLDRDRVETLPSGDVVADLEVGDRVSPDGTLRLRGGETAMSITRRSDGVVLATIARAEGEYFAYPKWSPRGDWLVLKRCSMTGPGCRVELLEVASPGAPTLVTEQSQVGLGRTTDGVVWRDAERLWIATQDASNEVILEWRVTAGAPLQGPREVHRFDRSVLAEIVGVVGDSLVYLRHTTTSNLNTSRRGADGHWEPPTIAQADIRGFAGWTRDSQLVWSRVNRTVGSTELVMGVPGGAATVIRPEDPGAYARAGAVVGDQIIHERRDGWYVLDGRDLRAIQVPGVAQVSCGTTRCVATVADGARFLVRELDLDKGLGDVILDLAMPGSGAPPAAVSIDDDQVAAAAWGEIVVSSRSHKGLRKRALDRNVQTLAFDGLDGRLVGVAFAPYSIVELEPSGRVRVVVSGSTYYSDLHISPDGATLAVASAEFVTSIETIALPE